ncbi:MAG: DUF4412 domain-containing protein [Nitrospirota bacterium]|nr:DUF4412 domain-containing protein [Nitrospirota bacterium]
MEKKRSAYLFLACLLTGILFTGTVVFSAPPDNFTAKMVMSEMVMPIAKMGNKMRVENPMMKGIVTITQMDLKKMIMMSTVNKTYTEQSIAEEMPSLYDSNVVFEKKKIGSETIDGHQCIKYNTVFYLKDKPAEKYRAIVWEAQDLGGLMIRNEVIMPERLRMGGPSKVVSELKDIKLGAAKSSMFEVPAGYKKVSSMMEIMGGMEGMEDMEMTPEQMKQMRKR